MYAVFIVAAAVSDAACLWLGLFYYLYRVDMGARRLGVGLLVHGLIAQFQVMETLNPKLLLGNGATDLRGWAWFLYILTTLFVYYAAIVPLFRVRRLQLRSQSPSAISTGAIGAGMVCTLLTVAVLASAGLPEVPEDPAFLPRGWLLAAYKVLSGLLASGLLVYTLGEYNDAKMRPLSPSVSIFIGSNIWRGQQHV